MISTFISTNNYRLENAERFINDISSNAYFFFVGDHIPHPNSDIGFVSNDTRDLVNDCYTNMIMGKKIKNIDVSLMTKNVPWVANTIYTMYDDQNKSLFDSDFHVNINEGSYTHIWKVLDNNNGAASTDQPTFAHASSTPYYQTSDGYRWKYMSSISSALIGKFATANLIPLVANTTVAAAAINNTIDIILVEHQGSRYNNYINGTFAVADVVVNGDVTLFNISNNSVSSSNGYYTGCLIYITSGTGQGQYNRIVEYVANSTGNIIKLERAFITTPDSTSVYQIRPEVIVVGTGAETVNCVARALVNSFNSNSVYRVEVLKGGSGFFNASATITANSIVGVTNTAIIRPIIGPPGGHGFNIFNELYSNAVCISVALANTENSTLPTNNMFQQIGIIKNPAFANVNVQFFAANGNWTIGETLYSYTAKKMNSNATTTVSSNAVTCNTADFVNQTMAGDYILITNQDKSLSELRVVNNVVNSSQINITNISSFSCTVSDMYYVTITSNCVCTNVVTKNSIFVSNCSSILGVGLVHLIGASSDASGDISSITRNDVVKGFDTFVEAYKYNATLSSGVFVENEIIAQGSIKAYLLEVVGSPNMTITVTNFNNGFFSNGTITGNTSGAIANVTKSYSPEILFGTGEIIYLENIEAINRAPTQTETFQIIFNY